MRSFSACRPFLLFHFKQVSVSRFNLVSFLVVSQWFTGQDCSRSGGAKQVNFNLFFSLQLHCEWVQVFPKSPVYQRLLQVWWSVWLQWSLRWTRLSWVFILIALLHLVCLQYLLFISYLSAVFGVFFPQPPGLQDCATMTVSFSASLMETVFHLLGSVMVTQTVRTAVTNTTPARLAPVHPHFSAVTMETACCAAGFVTETTTAGTWATNEIVPLHLFDVQAGSGSARDTVCVSTLQLCVTTLLTVPMVLMSLLSVVSLAQFIDSLLYWFQNFLCAPQILDCLIDPLKINCIFTSQLLIFLIFII